MNDELQEIDQNKHLFWMEKAILLAKKAEDSGEVPVGAVVVKNGVKNGELIGEGWNQSIQNHDPSAHAEVQALRSACQNQRNYRLIDTTLYVTLEPCAMCASAIVHARVDKVVFAAHDPRTGAAESVFALLDNPALNHQCEIISGVCAEQSSTLLKNFFRARR